MEMNSIKELKNRLNLVIKSNILLRFIFSLIFFFKNVKNNISNNKLSIILLILFSAIPIAITMFYFDLSIYNIEKLILKEKTNYHFLIKIGIIILKVIELIFLYISFLLNFLFINSLFQKTKNLFKENNFFYILFVLIIYLLNTKWLYLITESLLKQILVFILIIMLIHIMYLIIEYLKNKIYVFIEKKMNNDIDYLVIIRFLKLNKILIFEDKEMVDFLNKNKNKIEEYKNNLMLENF